MDRRTGMASAAAIVIITITGAAAIGTNLGVVERAPADAAGQLQPNDPELTTVVVEPLGQPATAATSGAPAQTNAVYGDDAEEHDGAERESDDDDEEEYEYEYEYEYEGRDDDD